MKYVRKFSKFSMLAIILILFFTLIFTFSLNLQEPTSAWGPPGTYSNRSYNVSQSSMVTRSSYSTYTASGHAYGYSHQKSHSGSKWHTQSTSTQYANYVMTIKLSDHIFNALRRGKVTLKVTVSCQFKTENRVANAYLYMKPFIAIGTISGTGLARDSFTNTNTNTGSEQYKKLKNSSSNVSSSTSSSGSSSSGQYVRFGGTFKTKSDRSWGSTALAQINSISMKLEISHSGDTTDPTISGTNNAFTTSSSVTLSDTGSGLRRYRINSGSWQNIASSSGPTTSKSISLSQQTNNIEVEDNVGRTASKTIKYYNPTISIARYTNGASSSTGGSITGHNSSGKTVGGTHTMTASANSGYYFVSWEKVNGAGTGHTYGQKSYSYQIASGDAYTSPLNFRAHFKGITTSNRTVTYDGSRQGVSFSPDAGFSVSYQYTNKSGTPSYSSSTAPYEAGSYNAKITVTRSGQEMGTKTVTLTINKRNITITADVGQSKTYGQSDPTFSYQITSGSLVSGDGLSGVLSRQTGENAGTYNITQGTLTSANNRNYNISFGTTRTFAINKKSVTITAQNKTITYGSSAPSFTFSYSGLVSGDSLSDTASTNYNRYDDVGSYQINVNSKTYTNYNPSYVNGTLTVNKKSITVKADNKQITYGDDVPGFTFSYTGVVNGDTLYDSAYVNYNQYNNVGNYTITVISRVYTNYTASYQNGTLTVNKKAIKVYADDKQIVYGESAPQLTLSHTGLVNNDSVSTELSVDYNRYDDAGAYTIEIVTPYDSYTNYYASEQNTGTLTVNKATVTVTPNNKTISYGDSAPNGSEYGFSYTGLVGSDTASIFSDTGYTDYSQGDGVNEYTIYVNSKTYTNYTQNKKTGKLFVEKKAITANIDAKSMVYGNSIPTLTVSYPSGSLVGGDSLSHQLETEYIPGQSDASWYPITAVEGANVFDNYDVSYNNGLLTVSKRPLDIHIDNKSIVYGSDIPEFTFTFGNTVYGDEAELALTESATVNYTQYGDVGAYTINFANHPTYTNYTRANEYTGTLTVAPRPLTITPDDMTITYGDERPSQITYIFDGVVNNDTLNATGEIVDCDLYPGAGDYDIVVSDFDEVTYKNYTWTNSGTGTLTVNKLGITIKVYDADVVYGEELDDFVFDITGLLSGDTIEVSASVNYTPFVTNAGTSNLIIEIDRTEYDNYVASYDDGVLTVLKAQAEIIAQLEQEALYTGGWLLPDAELNHSETQIYFQPANGYRDVGLYTVVAKADETTNYYAAADVAISFDIVIRELIIDAVSTEKIYGELDPDFTYNHSGLISGHTIELSLQRENVWLNHTGTYEISTNIVEVYSGSTDVTNNYNITFNSAEFEIKPFDIEIAANSGQSKTYGESDPVFSFTSVDLKYNDSFEGQLSRAIGEDIGAYAIGIGWLEISDGNGGNNYNISYAGADFTITPRPITITADTKSKTYGEADPTLSYQITQGNLVDGDFISGELVRETGQSVDDYYILQGSLAIEDGNDGDNYYLSYQIGQFTINKRPITITAHNKTKVYGENDPAFTYDVTGGIVYDDEFDGNLTRVSGQNVGDYDIEKGTLVIVDAPLNYKENNYDVTYIKAELEITVREITITAQPKEKTYGEADPDLTFVINEGSLAYSDNWIGELVRESGEDVKEGGYIINQGTVDINDNYDITYNSSILIINRRPIDVIADNSQQKVYGFSEPELTFYVPAGGLVFGDELAGELTRESGENVGLYAIYQNDVDNENNPNYDISFVGDDFEIKQRPITLESDLTERVYGESDPELSYSFVSGSLGLAFEDELSGGLIREPGENVGYYDILQGTLNTANNPNYDITYVFKGDDFTIIAREITISANDKSKVYGEADPELTYSVTSGSLAFSDSISILLSRATGIDVGDYEIDNEYLNIKNSQEDMVNFNYDISFVKGNLEITARDLYISADDIEKSYGDSDPELTYQITQGELVYGNQITGNLEREPGEYADLYAILIGSLTAGDNYNIIFTEGVFEILPLPITIVPDDKLKTYGDEDPEFTFTLTEGEIMLGDQLNIELSREGGEDVGSYEIVVGSISNPNYIISLESAHLTITQRWIQVAAEPIEKIYGFSDPELTYVVEAGELQFEDSLTDRLEREPGEIVDEYNITLISVANDNYDIDFSGNIFTITRRPITIIADDKTRIYGDDDPELSFSFDPLSYALAFEDELSGEMYRDSGEIVDVYTIRQGTITNVENTNYDITFVEGEFEITRRPVTVTPDVLTKHYGQQNPIYTYATDEGDLVFGDTLNGELTREEGIDVGLYEILQGTLTNANNPNYDIILIRVDFEITRRPITVTADYLYKIYGESDPEVFSYELSENALVYGDLLAGALTRQQGEDVDLYAILQGTVTNESNTNYDITYESDDFEIKRRALEISADAKEKIYGNFDPELTLQITEGELQFEDSVLGYLEREFGEDVGEYDIKAGTVDNETNPNYDITYIKAAFEIKRRPIKISANYHEKIYGNNDPVFSYQIVEGELVPGDALQGLLGRAAGNSVGLYTINQGTINNDYNLNYDIAFESDRLRILQRPLILIADKLTKVYGEDDPELTYSFMQGSLAYDDELYGALSRQPGESVGSYRVNVGNLAEHPLNSNYSITYQFDFFAIQPRAITITADYKSKVYGDSDPQLTYQMSENALVEGDSLRGSLVRNIGNNVGEYEILQGTINNLNNSNYDITYINNMFEITPRPIEITIDSGITKYYGDEDPEYSYQITQGNIAYYDILNGEFAREEGEIVGEYEILQGTVDNESNPNYDISFEGDILTIQQRPITVSPADLSKIYGEEDPELTYEVTEGGLVFDDELVGEIYREAGENVGEYEIYQGTLTTENNDNYVITYDVKPFVIERRPIALTAEQRAKVYGYDDPIFAYEITEGELIGSDTLSGQLSREEGEDVGLYQIVHGSLNNENNPNYDIILSEIFFSITQRLIAIEANYRSKIYGNNDPSLTYTITFGSLLQGDQLSGELEREEGEAVGSYDILQGTLDNTNYDIIFDSNIFVIHKRPLTLYAFEQSHPHGEEIDLDMEFGIEGNPLSQDLEEIHEAVSVVTTAVPESPVGTYPIMIEQNYELDNYNLSFIPSVLTIVAGSFEEGVDIWFEDERALYDGAEHIIEAGWNLDGITVTYSNNKGTEVGIYHATATFRKEHYIDMALSARLIITTNEIATTEPVPRGIVSTDEGFDPYTVPVIRQSTDENIFTLANSILDVGAREEVKTILNIQLRTDAEEIEPSSSVQIKLLMPSQVENLESLRLVHITSMGINNVEYTIEGDYIVFYGYELGDYAFITSEEAPSYETTAQIIFYTAIGALGLVVIVIISAAFKKKKKKMNRGRYL